MKNNKRSEEVLGILKSIVLLPTPARNFKPQYRKVLNLVIDNFIKEGVAKVGTYNAYDYAVNELAVLLYSSGFMTRYDEELGSLKTFVINYLFYACCNEHRKTKNKIKPIYTNLSEETVDDEVLADEELIVSERVALMKKYFGEEMYELLLAGMKPREMAKVLGKSSDTIRKFLYRKRKVLKELV